MCGLVIVLGIIVLVQKLNLCVVVEGVEEEVQFVFFYGVGCDEMQGFFFV